MGPDERGTRLDIWKVVWLNTSVLIWDPCPLGLHVTLIGAHACSQKVGACFGSLYDKDLSVLEPILGFPVYGNPIHAFTVDTNAKCTSKYMYLYIYIFTYTYVYMHISISICV